MNTNNEFSLATTTEENTTLIPSTINDDDERMIVDLTHRSTSYCSLVANTEDEKLTLYNAMNNPDFRLADMINEIINVKDVFVEVVHCTNRESGEVTSCPRIVLIDEAGAGYQCVSIGVFSALKKLFAVFGEPSEWTSTIPIKVKQLTKGERKMLTLEVVKGNKKKN